MIVRWGIIGCGDIARKRVAQAIRDHPHSRLVAACRRDREQLRAFCQTYGVERAYHRDVDLLNDPEIDAVYIATPVNCHLPQTMLAAQAEKHVLVEKPMACSVPECEQMIQVCRSQGVKLGVAYYRRFYPMVARMRELLAAGAIGQALAVTAMTSTPFAIKPDEEGYWRVIPAQGGGGALMDIGSHRIDLFLDLFGEVVDVKALGTTVAAAYEAEDTASLLVRFSSGMHGLLQCLFGTTANLDSFSVIGTKGRLRADPLNGSQLVVEVGTETRSETQAPAANLHAPLIADFVAAIQEGREPRVTGEAGRYTNEVMERAYRDAGMRWVSSEVH